MKLTELKDKLKSIVDRLDAVEITTDQAVIELNGLFPPAPPRSAEEILNEFYMKNLRCTGAMFLPMEVAIEAMHAYASQFRREVTDAEIEAESDKYGFRVPYDGSNNFYDKLAIKAFIDGAKWMREKMMGE